MKARLSAIVSVLVAAALWAAPAAAVEMKVAGWDFSQYLGDGVLSTDGSTFTSTLSANYSEWDATGNAGADAAMYGTMYMDGSFGSTNVSAGSGSEEVLPFAGSLAGNIRGPVHANGDNAFDAHTRLAVEGQDFTNLLSLIAGSASSVVFEADLTPAATTGDNWVLHFGGNTFRGTSTVSVDFSTDGSSFSNVGSVMLTTDDAAYEVFLDTATSATGYVRLGFSPGSGEPIIDNVTINIPEPIWGAQVMAGVMGLFLLRRLRG